MLANSAFRPDTGTGDALVYTTLASRAGDGENGSARRIFGAFSVELDHQRDWFTAAENG